MSRLIYSFSSFWLIDASARVAMQGFLTRDSFKLRQKPADHPVTRAEARRPDRVGVTRSQRVRTCSQRRMMHRLYSILGGHFVGCGCANPRRNFGVTPSRCRIVLDHGERALGSSSSMAPLATWLTRGLSSACLAPGRDLNQHASMLQLLDSVCASS